MDTITATLGSVRVGRASGRRITETGALGLSFPPMPIVAFHVMLAGDGWLITDDGADPVPLRPGDVVFTGSGARHGIARSPCRLAELPEVVQADVDPREPADFEFLCASYPKGDRTPPLLRRLPGVVAVRPDYARHPQLPAVVEMLRDDFTTPGGGTEIYRSGLIDVLLVHILRLLEERTGAPGLPPGIAEAVRAIHDDPSHPWTVQQLSAVAGMSRTAFNRHFTAATGRAPRAYLTDQRLSSAARLLRETDAPLAVVARRVGYASEFAFAAAFRRSYGSPPGRYRQESTVGGRAS